MWKNIRFRPRILTQEFLPIACFTIYVGVSVWILMTGHLHEDAYILYVYAKNLASGNGITYFPGGEPTEGATDFLWMIMLALADYLSLDAALAAAILNGIGIAAITYLAIRLASNGSRTVLSLPIAFVLTALILLSQITTASLAGFSTGFYCAIVALIFCLLYSRDCNLLKWIPVTGIILGLVRPDGVIIGVIATLIGCYYAYSANTLRSYLKVSIMCLLLGLVYFIWRYLYFGHLFPLPLYVKSINPETLPGLSGHIGWAARNFHLGLLAWVSIILLRDRWRILIASIPMAALLIALLFATQTQNAEDRLQAPATVVLILWIALFLRQLTNDMATRTRIWQWPLALAATVLLAAASVNYAKASMNMTKYLRENQYINSFPHLLSPYIPPDTTIVLTEAGRFAYFSPGRKFDLVGLNTPDTAIHQSTPDQIQAFDPDLIFIHVADTASFVDICSGNYCELTTEQVLMRIQTKEEWAQVEDSVRRAPLVVYEYLRAHPDAYRIFAVRYYPNYKHLYLLKLNGTVDVNDFVAALERSFTPEFTMSYWQILKENP